MTITIPYELLNFIVFYSLLSTIRLLTANEYAEVSWGPYKKDDLAAHEKLSRFHHLRILPPHQSLRLHNPDLEYLMKMKEHHEMLEKKKFAYVFAPYSLF